MTRTEAALPTWDVFHSDRLEAERSLTTEAVRLALARGELGEEDLVRPSGESRWTRIGDSAEFGDFDPVEPAPVPVPEPPAPAAFEPGSIDEAEEDDSEESDLSRFEVDPESLASIERAGPAPASPVFEPPTEFEILPDSDPEIAVAEPVLPDDQTHRSDMPELVAAEEEPPSGEFDPQDEDEEAAEFTLSRNSPETVEELDLAAMVDVAFQLVLFFLVTASTVVFKTLEVPRPNEDKPPEAAAQGRAKSVEELEADYILVEVDAEGSIKVDRQPINPDRAALTEKLRSSREATHRKAMLLSADFFTRHKNAVMVFDVANEIDLGIAIAQPTGKK